MYDILTLNDKSLSELQEIAKEYNIKGSLDNKHTLIYAILDHQASFIENENKKSKSPAKRAHEIFKDHLSKTEEKTKPFVSEKFAIVEKEILLVNSKSKKVFISYNHRDKDIANKLREKLKGFGLDVIIDSDRMLPGDDIKKFIEESISAADITISIISKQSLLSAWVAMESINTFEKERSKKEKKFIACYISDAFFELKFTDEALDYIEGKMMEIENIISERLSKRRNFRDLNGLLERYRELGNNIDEIIRRLRESLSIDLREENFETNLEKLVKAI